VFSNLLNNAAKFTEPGGHISLTAERQDSEIVVSVKDTGIGITPEMLPRIWDLFTQADSSRERSQGGLGLGLTLVKRLVELHGGSVNAFSEGPNRGSEIVVHLPALVGQVKAPAVVRDETPSTTGRSILVVDDNKDSAESLSMLLSRSKQDQIAHDGTAALRLPRRSDPTVLLDIGLPR
jgi:CheY-like chemotaxis protein